MYIEYMFYGTTQKKVHPAQVFTALKAGSIIQIIGWESFRIRK